MSDTEYDNETEGMESPKELREAYEQQKKENEALRQLADTAHTELRQANASQIFGQMGLPSAQVELFLKSHDGEVTREAVQGFVQTYQLAPQPPTQAAAPPPMSNMMSQAAGPGQPVGATNQMTTQQALAALKADPNFIEQMAAGNVTVPPIDGNKFVGSVDYSEFKRANPVATQEGTLNG